MRDRSYSRIKGGQSRTGKGQFIVKQIRRRINWEYECCKVGGIRDVTYEIEVSNKE